MYVMAVVLALTLHTLTLTLILFFIISKISISMLLSFFIFEFHFVLGFIFFFSIFDCTFTLFFGCISVILFLYFRLYLDFVFRHCERWGCTTLMSFILSLNKSNETRRPFVLCISYSI